MRNFVYKDNSGVHLTLFLKVFKLPISLQSIMNHIFSPKNEALFPVVY